MDAGRITAIKDFPQYPADDFTSFINYKYFLKRKWLKNYYTMKDSDPKKKIMAVASAGGHWIELLRLKSAFNNCEVIFVSTDSGNSIEVEGFEYYQIANATRKSFWNIFRMLIQLIRIIRKVRPRVIITTGSAPGLMALVVGKLFGTKNVWIDSIANVNELSTSGKKARYFSDLYLTLWQHLAKQNGPEYKGSLL